MRTLAVGFLCLLSACAATPPAREDHNRTGLELAAQGRYDAAIAQFLAAIAIEPREPQLFNNLGFAHYLRGHRAQAIEAFEHALELDPGYAKARKNLELARERPAAVAAVQEKSAPPTPSTPPAQGDLVQVAPNVYELRGMPVQRRQAPPARRFRLEVANGNGGPGMARRIAKRLSAAGEPHARLTNHRDFRQAATLIEYRKDFAAEAARVRAELGPRVRLVEVARIVSGAEVRVLVGQDLLRS
jgi:tetratricopeptide (TPR) repeat protein